LHPDSVSNGNEGFGHLAPLAKKTRPVNRALPVENGEHVSHKGVGRRTERAAHTINRLHPLRKRGQILRGYFSYHAAPGAESIAGTRRGMDWCSLVSGNCFHGFRTICRRGKRLTEKVCFTPLKYAKANDGEGAGCGNSICAKQRPAVPVG